MFCVLKLWQGGAVDAARTYSREPQFQNPQTITLLSCLRMNSYSRCPACRISKLAEHVCEILWKNFHNSSWDSSDLCFWIPCSITGSPRASCRELVDAASLQTLTHLKHYAVHGCACGGFFWSCRDLPFLVCSGGFRTWVKNSTTKLTLELTVVATSVPLVGQWCFCRDPGVEQGPMKYRRPLWQRPEPGSLKGKVSCSWTAQMPRVVVFYWNVPRSGQRCCLVVRCVHERQWYVCKDRINGVFCG